MHIIIISELECERGVFEPAPAFFAQAVPEKRIQPVTAEDLPPAPKHRLISFQLYDFNPVGACLMKDPNEEPNVLIFRAAIVFFGKHASVKTQGPNNS